MLAKTVPLVITDSLSTETREGWPLLTFETEMNGDSKSTNERGPSLVGSLSLSCRAGTRDFVLPWLLYSAQYKVFIPHPILFHFLLPHRQASWAGSRAGSPIS